MSKGSLRRAWGQGVKESEKDDGYGGARVYRHRVGFGGDLRRDQIEVVSQEVAKRCGCGGMVGVGTARRRDRTGAAWQERARSCECGGVIPAHRRDRAQAASQEMAERMGKLGWMDLQQVQGVVQTWKRQGAVVWLELFSLVWLSGLQVVNLQFASCRRAYPHLFVRRDNRGRSVSGLLVQGL